MAYDSAKVPSIFKSIKWRAFTVNLDIGGGEFEDATMYLAERDVTNLVYDPDHRSAEHNRDVIVTVIARGGSDSVTLANVLNVIPKWKDRDALLYYSDFLAKKNAPIYIGVYEGDKSGRGRKTDTGWQANLQLHEYLDAVRNRFRVVSATNEMITAVKDL